MRTIRHPAAASLLAALLAGSLGACDAGQGETEGPDTASNSESATESQEPERLAGIAALHNEVRAEADPKPRYPLPPLKWDPKLAQVAQAHADRCVYGHSRGPYGENLYAGAGQQATPEQVVEAWAGEADLYDHATGTCSGVCGHYTQIVWAETWRVGCGVATCSTGSPFEGFSTWESWVCNYDPPGNVQGERPY